MIAVNIQKSLGDFTLNVEFSAGNEVLALLGGSGSGKSMTLRAIAGIITPDSGRIVVDGTVFYDSAQKINLTPQQRQVGLLFQNYALFPTMTVLENIMAGVRQGRRTHKRQIALEAVERYQLSGLENRYPRELSGGQQQRVALARILMGQPKLLMLDEPFSALDSHLRDQLQREVLKLTGSFDGTTLLVSHSRDEVFRMADRVAVYHQGAIDVIGEKHQVFSQPGTYRAALLTGCKNFSRVERLRVKDGETWFYAADWGLELSLQGQAAGSMAGIRGHHITQADGPGPNTFQMEVVDALEDTFEYVLQVRPVGSCATPIYWMLSKDAYRALPPGKLYLHFPQRALMLLRG